MNLDEIRRDKHYSAIYLCKSACYATVRVNFRPRKATTKKKSVIIIRVLYSWESAPLWDKFASPNNLSPTRVCVCDSVNSKFSLGRKNFNIGKLVFYCVGLTFQFLFFLCVLYRRQNQPNVTHGDKCSNLTKKNSRLNQGKGDKLAFGWIYSFVKCGFKERDSSPTVRTLLVDWLSNKTQVPL